MSLGRAKNVEEMKLERELKSYYKAVFLNDSYAFLLVGKGKK